MKLKQLIILACILPMPFLSVAQDSVEIVPPKDYLEIEGTGFLGGGTYWFEYLFKKDGKLFIYQNRANSEDILHVVDEETMEVIKLIDHPFRIEDVGDYYDATGFLDSNYYIAVIKGVDDYHKVVNLHFVDENWLEDSEGKLLHKTYQPEDETVRVKVLPDPKGNFIAITELRQQEDGLERERITLYNKDFEKVLVKDQEPTHRFKNNYEFASFNRSFFMNEYFSVKEFLHTPNFDEKGNMYFISGKYLIVYRVDQGYERFVYRLPDHHYGQTYSFQNLDMYIDNEQIFISAELIETKSRVSEDHVDYGYAWIKNVKGYYSTVISQEDFDLRNKYLHLLEEEEMAPVDGPSGFNVNKNTRALSHIETIQLENGGYLRISERWYTNLSYVYTGNISISKYSKTGDFEWVRYLEKNQSIYITDFFRTADPISVIRAAYSFQYVEKDGKLYFMYNQRKPLPEDEDAEIAIYSASHFDETDLHICELNPQKGEMKNYKSSPYLMGEFVMLPFGKKGSRSNAYYMLLGTAMNKDFRIGKFQLSN